MEIISLFFVVSTSKSCKNSSESIASQTAIFKSWGPGSVIEFELSSGADQASELAATADIEVIDNGLSRHVCDLLLCFPETKKGLLRRAER
jgi:hypothetical protein